MNNKSENNGFTAWGLALAFILISCNAFNQSNSNMNEEVIAWGFEIRSFKISPNEKLVYKQQMTGGSKVMPDGSVMHWDGSRYVPAREIDFEKTSLIFMGNTVTFKEFFPVKADVSSLEVIHHSIGYSNNYTTVLSHAEHTVYVLRDDWIVYQTDIKDYTHIRNVIFKNKEGDLFFMPFARGHLVKITIPVDESTLNFVVDKYFTDKNGLYFYDDHKNNIQQIESSEGKDIQPVLHPRYLVYGNAAYPTRGWTNNLRGMRLDAALLREVKLLYGSYIGDNKQLLCLPYSNTTAVSALTVRDLIQEGAPQEPVSEWNLFDVIVVGGNRKGKTLYYSSKMLYAGSGSYYCLIKTSENFYGITGSSARQIAEKLDDVKIYNIENQQYETIELDKFKRLTTNFYIYKNQLYYTDSYPVETDIDLENLHPILLHENATEFYTDGKYLLGGCNFAKMETENRNNQTWYKFAEPLFQDVDWQNLQVVDEKTMIDKHNIYQVENSVLQVTSIESLGLDVKIVDTRQ